MQAGEGCRAWMRRLTRRRELAGRARGFWGVGQLADRRTVNPEVGGSSPPAPALPPCTRLYNSRGPGHHRMRRVALHAAVISCVMMVLAPSLLHAHARLVRS